MLGSGCADVPAAGRQRPKAPTCDPSAALSLARIGPPAKECPHSRMVQTDPVQTPTETPRARSFSFREEPWAALPKRTEGFTVPEIKMNLRYASSSDEECGRPGREARPRETDAKRLAVRQRQLDIGKATEGYIRYRRMVPALGGIQRRGDPRTPEKEQICSKRSWDGQISKWRRALHAYDPKSED